jgi:hypothetical protein
MKKIKNYFFELPYEIIEHIFTFIPRLRKLIHKVIKNNKFINDMKKNYKFIEVSRENSI